MTISVEMVIGRSPWQLSRNLPGTCQHIQTIVWSEHAIKMQGKEYKQSKESSKAHLAKHLAMSQSIP